MEERIVFFIITQVGLKDGAFNYLPLLRMSLTIIWLHAIDYISVVAESLMHAARCEIVKFPLKDWCSREKRIVWSGERRKSLLSSL